LSEQKTIDCPYCDHQFEKMPADRTGCPQCLQILYVYDSPLSRRKVLLTEEGLYKIIKVPPSKEQTDYFTSRLLELEAAFGKAKASSQHYGERGRELESLVWHLLEEYLPNKYKLATGFVRSLEKPEWISKQIDIIFSRNDICYPIAVHNQYSVFPLESIISFMEVTSTLTKGKLLEDYEKVSDLQVLNNRFYYVPTPPAGVALYPATETAVRPRFFYFAYATDCSSDAICEALLRLSNQYRAQLHCLFVLKPGISFIMPNAVPDLNQPYQSVLVEDRPREAIITFLNHILTSLQTADFIPPNASIPFQLYYDPSVRLSVVAKKRRRLKQVPSLVKMQRLLGHRLGLRRHRA
jgi:hypothetical protein